MDDHVPGRVEVVGGLVAGDFDLEICGDLRSELVEQVDVDPLHVGQAVQHTLNDLMKK